MSSDLLIHAGYLLRIGDDFRSSEAVSVSENRLIHVQGSKIAAIEAATPEAIESAKARSRRFIDASRKLVMPGLVNSHMHLPMSLLRGVAEDVPFHDWIHKFILPIEAKILNPQMARVGAELALLESLRSGVTAVADMYYFEDEIAAVADRVGVRGLFAVGAFDFEVPDSGSKTGLNVKGLERLIERFSRHERVRPALGPHSPYSCGDETLKDVMAWAEKENLPVMIHVSETKPEVHDHQKAHGGMTPPERLEKLGFLSLKPLFAHGVHLTDSDIELCARRGVKVAYNPESNMKLSSGAARIAQLKAAGLVLGIGTDGAASNNDLDLFKEMDSGAKLQKFAWRSYTEVSARDMIYMATLGGARCLGMENEIGSIEVGKRADFAILDLDVPEMRPIFDLPSQLVYAASARFVDTVICHGKVLLDGGRPTTIDVPKLLSEVDREGDRIRAFIRTSRA